ncbi:MAG TPA: hypothetical protein DCS55_10345 [Acidimicrobiaceae bacterium]|nr:hypothetical protein [Acidimicrobiaceae bacterium]
MTRSEPSATETFAIEVERIRGAPRLRRLAGWFLMSLATEGSGMTPPERQAVVRRRDGGEVVARIPGQWDAVAGADRVDNIQRDLESMTSSEFEGTWL